MYTPAHVQQKHLTCHGCIYIHVTRLYKIDKIVRRRDLNFRWRNIGKFFLSMSQPELVKIAMETSAQNVFNQFSCTKRIIVVYSRNEIWILERWDGVYHVGIAWRHGHNIYHHMCDLPWSSSSPERLFFVRRGAVIFRVSLSLRCVDTSDSTPASLDPAASLPLSPTLSFWLALSVAVHFVLNNRVWIVCFVQS
jgi:hypothetical protein